MAHNKVNDLRDHLFATLEALQDKKDPMEVARAEAIAQVAQVIVNSAKVEVDFMKVTDRSFTGSDYFQPVQKKLE